MLVAIIYGGCRSFFRTLNFLDLLAPISCTFPLLSFIAHIDFFLVVIGFISWNCISITTIIKAREFTKEHLYCGGVFLVMALFSIIFGVAHVLGSSDFSQYNNIMGLLWCALALITNNRCLYGLLYPRNTTPILSDNTRMGDNTRYKSLHQI